VLLHRPVRQPPGIVYLLEARLAQGPEIEVFLQQQPQQLEALGLYVLLELEVLERAGLVAGEKAADLYELGERRVKAVGEGELAGLPDLFSRGRVLGLLSRATSCCRPALPCASRPALAERKRSVAIRTGSTSAGGSINSFVLPPSL